MREATTPRASRTGHSSVGRRKEAVARVRLQPGNGIIIIDGKQLAERFPRLVYQKAISAPLERTNTLRTYNVMAKVTGGGLTRDSRVKERKKYGLKRARKAPQYTKR